MSMTTVADIIELALPPQTVVVAGRESIDVEVSWRPDPARARPPLIISVEASSYC